MAIYTVIFWTINHIFPDVINLFTIFAFFNPVFLKGRLNIKRNEGCRTEWGGSGKTANDPRNSKKWLPSPRERWKEVYWPLQRRVNDNQYCWVGNIHEDYEIKIKHLTVCLIDLHIYRWVRTRRALLVLFLLGWLGMLAGAIVIIVQAPRCKPIPEMNWWNEGPLYQISDVNEFSVNGLKGK